MVHGQLYQCLGNETCLNSNGLGVTGADRVILTSNN